MTENSRGLDEPEIVNEATKKFWEYLNVNEVPKTADVIFILGGSSLAPVYRAAELYDQGYAPKIAFISQGGKFGGEAVWGMSEVDKYRQTLLELGVPQDAIVYQGNPEKQTRNTLAEAKAAIPFIRERGIDPKRIILVSRPVHQRRAYSTFEQQNPGIEYVNCPGEEPLSLGDPEDEKRIAQEAERLLDYGVRKSDIKRPEIPRDILRAAAIIRKHLKREGIYEPRQKPPKA